MYSIEACFSPSIVIVGDSNLVRIQNELENDVVLRRYKITLHCRPGFRAAFLNGEDVVFCANFTHCILLLGNNDISQHPNKPELTPETPLKSAARLCGFAKRLQENSVEVKVVGLLNRPDTEYEPIQQTNIFLQNFMQTDYVGPRYVRPIHFLKENIPYDLAHLNEDGKKRVLALFLSILTTRFEVHP